jgi:hypothetical protein
MVLMWFLAGLVATPSFVEYTVTTVTLKENTTTESCSSSFTSTYSIMNGICVLLLAYVVPLFIMWYNYAIIIRFVMKKTSSVNDVASVPSSQVKRDTRNETEQDQPNRQNQPNRHVPQNSSLEQAATNSGVGTNKTPGNRDRPVQQGFLLANRMKIIQMLIVVAVLFAISWLPYFVSLLIAVSIINLPKGQKFVNDGFFCMQNILIKLILRVMIKGKIP